MVERAYAKINLTLEVVGKRDDGYHNIRSIMQTVSLCDYITVKKDESDAIIIQSDKCNIPTDKRNL
ncbi:MAG: 4-(cytidine 5'-diphospho)-2-C-methyl-D-erythritol kinase, partial [Eubacteriales bacterium]|nr:4-(cytidine 5'-diphospho)-2-C-methyl-D-erythritol kinase [Eubacteriales bacterium]